MNVKHERERKQRQELGGWTEQFRLSPVCKAQAAFIHEVRVQRCLGGAQVELGFHVGATRAWSGAGIPLSGRF